MCLNREIKLFVRSLNEHLKQSTLWQSVALSNPESRGTSPSRGLAAREPPAGAASRGRAPRSRDIVARYVDRTILCILSRDSLSYYAINNSLLSRHQIKLNVTVTHSECAAKCELRNPRPSTTQLPKVANRKIALRTCDAKWNLPVGTTFEHVAGVAWRKQ